MRVVLEGIKVASQVREGRGRSVVGEEAESWRWRVWAVSILNFKGVADGIWWDC